MQEIVRQRLQVGGIPLIRWDGEGAFTIDILDLSEIQCEPIKPTPLLFWTGS